MACVIPFPARRPDNTPNSYAFLIPIAQRWMADNRAQEAAAARSSAPADPEKEIIKLLRRIDRRLAKLSAV